MKNDLTTATRALEAALARVRSYTSPKLKAEDHAALAALARRVEDRLAEIEGQ